MFLDEIGELGLEQQKKLLRVLQTRSYSRLGETTERKVNARIILSTNRDLRNAVEEGVFRDDLYYRLAAHCVNLPPLRERPGDIELLSGYFLRKYCSQFGRTLRGFNDDAMKRLLRYRFPGNVRELEGIISAAVLLEQSCEVTAATLPEQVLFAEPEARDLEAVRFRAIINALAECGGNQTKAAKKLGIARSTLNRLLRGYREKGFQS